MNKCPVCKDEKEKVFLCKTSLAYGTVFNLVKCPECNTSFFNPLPSVSQLEDFYSAGYYDFNREREEGKGMAFAGKLKKIKETGRFLDVGCATGFFINGIKNNSRWEVCGTDFSQDAVDFAKDKLGIDARQGNLEKVKFPENYFDYIHVNNVLEHVLDPVLLLNECRRIIKPDGTLFLSVPNGENDCLDIMRFYKEEKTPAKSRNGHIFFFPAKTIINLIDKSGFRVIKKRTYGFKRGLRSAGLIPQKTGWKEGYYPDKEKKSAVNPGIHLPGTSRKHSDLYYKYRFFLGNFSMLKGLYKYGLDFLFILKPKP